jgi:hypothetical protein
MSIMTVPENFLKKKGIKNPELIIWGLGAVVGLIVVYVIYKKVSGLFSGGTAAAAAMQDQLSTLSYNTADLTISQDQATLIAGNLLDAMNRIGCDDQAIIDNLNQCQTQADLLLVIKTFGIKPFDGFLATTFIGKLLSEPKDLAGWIRGKSSISSDNLTTISNIFANLNVPF